jgi:hypothetical protein
MSTVVIAAAGGVALLAFYAYTRPGVQVQAPVTGGVPTSQLNTTPLPTQTVQPTQQVAPTNTVQPPPPCDYSIAHINALRSAAGLLPLDPTKTTITPMDQTPGVCTYEAKVTEIKTTTTPSQPAVFHCRKGTLYPNWPQSTCLAEGGTWEAGYSPSGPAYTYCGSGGNVTTTTCT